MEATYTTTMPSRMSDLKRLTNRLRPSVRSRRTLSKDARRAREKFLRFFPGGFGDETYIEWERGYKETAYEKWCSMLRLNTFRSILSAGDYAGIAAHAVSIESRTNLLFSFEKMALRDAVRTPEGARAFACGLFEFLHGKGSEQSRFEQWVDVVSQLPRRQTRVLTWPMVTVFGFMAQPDRHVFLKPLVTRRAAEEYGFPFEYDSRPNWRTQEDPIGLAGGMNLYGFAGGDPVNFSDPFGLSQCPPNCDPPVKFSGVTANLVIGAGMAFAAGEWSNGKEKGTYVRASVAVGLDVNAGIEVGRATSFDAFSGGGQSISGGALILTGSGGGNKSGTVWSGGVTLGPTEGLPFSGHTETGWTHITSRSPVSTPVPNSAAPADATSVRTEKPQTAPRRTIRASP